MSSVQIYSYIRMIQPESFHLASSNLQLSQQSVGNVIHCLLASRIDLLPRMCNACLSKGRMLRPRSRSPLHILEFQSYSIFLFSLQ